MPSINGKCAGPVDRLFILCPDFRAFQFIGCHNWIHEGEVKFWLHASQWSECVRHAAPKAFEVTTATRLRETRRCKMKSEARMSTPETIPNDKNRLKTRSVLLGIFGLFKSYFGACSDWKARPLLRIRYGCETPPWKWASDTDALQDLYIYPAAKPPWM